MHSTSHRLVQKKDTFQYVPLLDGLRTLLLNQEIRDEVAFIAYSKIIIAIKQCHHFLLNVIIDFVQT